MASAKRAIDHPWQVLIDQDVFQHQEDHIIKQTFELIEEMEQVGIPDGERREL
jgi:hypothetical protein